MRSSIILCFGLLITNTVRSEPSKDFVEHRADYNAASTSIMAALKELDYEAAEEGFVYDHTARLGVFTMPSAINAFLNFKGAKVRYYFEPSKMEELKSASEGAKVLAELALASETLFKTEPFDVDAIKKDLESGNRLILPIVFVEEFTVDYVLVRKDGDKIKVLDALYSGKNIDVSASVFDTLLATGTAAAEGRVIMHVGTVLSVSK